MKDKLEIEHDLFFLKKLLINHGFEAGNLVIDVLEGIEEELIILKTVYNIKDK
jgi:hypothetical protein